MDDGTFFTGKFYRTDTESTAHGVAAIELNSASHTAGLNLIVVVTDRPRLRSETSEGLTRLDGQ